jgi:hypothetical protein
MTRHAAIATGPYGTAIGTQWNVVGTVHTADLDGTTSVHQVADREPEYEVEVIREPAVEA